MEILGNLIQGFHNVLQPANLGYCFMGVFLGTLIGVLAGVDPIATIAILIPITMKMPPVAAIIVVAGIFYGAMYGGTITSVLVNIPGEAPTVVTCFDGYQMALAGRAGPTLGIAAFGSFIAGTVGVIWITLLAAPLAKFATLFGPPEYFGVMFLGLPLACLMTRGAMLKATLMALLGLVLSFVGMDAISGAFRLTLGSMKLWDGIGLMPLVMGLFGVSEVMFNLERPSERKILMTRVISGLLPLLRKGKKIAKEAAGLED